MLKNSLLEKNVRNYQIPTKNPILNSQMIPLDNEPLNKDKRFALIRRFLATI